MRPTTGTAAGSRIVVTIFPISKKLLQVYNYTTYTPEDKIRTRHKKRERDKERERERKSEIEREGGREKATLKERE